MTHDPTFAMAIVFGGWALSVFAYGCWWLSAMQNPQRRRALFGLLTLVCLLIASPIALYADQPVLNPCTACASAEPWSWIWICLGCWSCP